ncbi:hypothetical protein GC105_07785 [Alkalibaculum sp. M08DMB]|uniref:Mpv17/PMP22 family protein n=1 Tax=Alkalibaculum sporogenes TaxID=2655001 RepID=A0A6A7K866_9FIRM|nr:hypothetical protein [Alkalibaculum sporogenes]MPW25689.1 hypothetical protein [Alkalibaculum sporogenes]
MISRYVIKISKSYTGEIIWTIILALWVFMLLVPVSRNIFIEFTSIHPYISGFIKFLILATLGDLAGNRIINETWAVNTGTLLKGIIWGIIGIMIVLVFTIFNGGVIAAQAASKLPGEGSMFLTALLTSVIMNLTFGPIMFLFHKFCDTYIDMRVVFKEGKISIKSVIERIDFYNMISFSFFKTIPLFWIPCHTIVFLLPGVYRVVVSAFLSIALGLLLAVSKKQKSSVGGVAIE